MWNQALVRELAVVLVIKLAALYVIWLTFFHQPNERELTHQEVGQLLLSDSDDGVTSSYQSSNK